MKKKRRRRTLIAMLSVFVCLLLVIAGLGVGWYFWGVTLTVTTNPPNSRVFVDGREIGRTRDGDGVIAMKHVRTGEHSLRIVREGYDEWKQSFTTTWTDFTLNKGVSVKLNQTKYKLTIVSTPTGSDVLLDDKPLGKTSYGNGSLESAPLLPGEHTVVVQHDQYFDWKQTVTLNADLRIEATLSVRPVLESGAEGEIQATLEDWAQTVRNRDLDAHLRHYADSLEYFYNLTPAPKSKVREDRSKAFAKFNTQMSVQLSNMTIEPLGSLGQSATVVFDKAFDFQGTNGAFYKGSVQDQLTLTKQGSAWLIIGEKELKVYRVEK